MGRTRSRGSFRAGSPPSASGRGARAPREAKPPTPPPRVAGPCPSLFGKPNNGLLPDPRRQHGRASAAARRRRRQGCPRQRVAFGGPSAGRAATGAPGLGGPEVLLLRLAEQAPPRRAGGGGEQWTSCQSECFSIRVADAPPWEGGPGGGGGRGPAVSCVSPGDPGRRDLEEVG